MRSALAAAAPATPFPFRTRTLVSERVSVWRIEPFFLAVSGSGPATFVTAASCTRAETPCATCVPTMIPSTPSSSRARAVATIVAVRQRESEGSTDGTRELIGRNSFAASAPYPPPGVRNVRGHRRERQDNAGGVARGGASCGRARGRLDAGARRHRAGGTRAGARARRAGSLAVGGGRALRGGAGAARRGGDRAGTTTRRRRRL